MKRTPMPRRKGQLKRTDIKRNKPLGSGGKLGYPVEPDESDEPPEVVEPIVPSRKQQRPTQSRGWRSTGKPSDDPGWRAYFSENEVRVIVYTRACLPGEGTARCEWCGIGIRFGSFSFHHRLPGQMGGDRISYWHPSRLMLLCGSGTTGCHGLVEHNRTWAYQAGLLVRRPQQGIDPADRCASQAVVLRGGAPPSLRGMRPYGGTSIRAFLTPEGHYREAP